MGDDRPAGPVLDASPVVEGDVDDGFDSVWLPDQRWTTAGVAEMLPGLLPPLIWEVNRSLVESGLRQHLDRLQPLPAALDEQGGFLGRFRGQAALRLDLMEAVAASTPGGREGDVERQYFGSPAPSQSDAPGSRAGHRWSWGAARHGFALARERSESQVESAIVEEAVRVATSQPLDLERRGRDELLVLRARLLDLASRAVAAEIAVAASAVVAYRRLEVLLARRVGEAGAARTAQQLTRAAGERGGRLAGPGSSRSVFGGPTWEEGDAFPPSLAPPSSDAATQEGWDRLLRDLRDRPGWTSTRAVTGQFVDLRLLALRRVLEDAIGLLGRRDRTKAAVLELGGCVRRVHLEIGRRFVGDGLLAEADAVHWLGEGEITGRSRFPDAEEIGRRAAWLARQGDRPLPQQWRGRPPPPADHAEVPVATGAVLRGWAAAPGRHRGPVRIVTSPLDAELDPGDVLVARTTDPSWTPVILQAGALVTEQGGPLSHAAILAREVGIPAVGNLAGATTMLAGAGQVLVDGDAGIVLVDPSEDVTVADDQDRARS